MAFSGARFGVQAFGSPDFGTGSFGDALSVGPAVWTPLALGDKLKGWWDAHQVSSLTISGGKVSSWRDRKSGIAVTQPTSSLQPDYQASAINGLPALHFDNQTLFNSGPTGLPSGKSGRGMYVVYSSDYGPEYAGAYTSVAQGATSVGNGRFAMQARPAILGDPFFSGWGADIASGLERDTLPKQAYVWHQGHEIYASLTSLYADGVQYGTDFGGYNGYLYIDTQDILYVGSNQDNEFMYGMVGDIVFTNGLETIEERQKVEGYLAWKYLIYGRLPADHPYKTAAPEA